MPDVLTIIRNKIVFLELKVGSKPVFRPGQVAVGQKLDAASAAVVVCFTGSIYLVCRYLEVGSEGDFSRAQALQTVNEESIWKLISN